MPTHELPADHGRASDFFRGIIDCLPFAVVITSEEGLIVEVNTEAERVFGYAREDMIGFPVELLIPKDDRAVHVRERERYRQRPVTRRMGLIDRLRGLRSDGTIFPADIRLSPYRFEDRLYVIATVQPLATGPMEDAGFLRRRIATLEADVQHSREGLASCPNCGADLTHAGGAQ